MPTLRCSITVARHCDPLTAARCRRSPSVLRHYLPATTSIPATYPAPNTACCVMSAGLASPCTAAIAACLVYVRRARAIVAQARDNVLHLAQRAFTFPRSSFVVCVFSFLLVRHTLSLHTAAVCWLYKNNNILRRLDGVDGCAVRATFHRQTLARDNLRRGHGVVCGNVGRHAFLRALRGKHRCLLRGTTCLDGPAAALPVFVRSGNARARRTAGVGRR